MKRYVKIISCAVAVILCLNYPVSASETQKNAVEFRLLLTPEESKGRGCDKVSINGEIVTICTLPYLADRDIEAMEVFASSSERGRYMIRFTFNENGRRRLYRLTKKYRARKIAIFIGNRFMEVTPVLPAIFMGDKVVLRWQGSIKDLRSIAGSMNKKLPDIFALYVEEMGKYNDAAADSWADMYARVNSYVGGRQKQARRDQPLIEAAREEQE